MGEFSIESSDREKLLGIKIDNKLWFDRHVSETCKKASRNINVIAIIAPYITQPAITCSKLTIETLEQGVKYVQS